MLHEPVLYRREAQQPRATVRFGAFRPPHRTGYVGPVEQLGAEHRPVLPEVLPQLPGGQAIDTRRAAVAHHGAQRDLGVLDSEHLFHQFLVHRFLSGVARRTLLSTADLRRARLHRGGLGRPSRVVTVVVAPAGFRFLALGPTAAPLALLRISSALRSAPLSRHLRATLSEKVARGASTK